MCFYLKYSVKPAGIGSRVCPVWYYGISLGLVPTTACFSWLSLDSEALSKITLVVNYHQQPNMSYLLVYL